MCILCTYLLLGDVTHTSVCRDLFAGSDLPLIKMYSMYKSLSPPVANVLHVRGSISDPNTSISQ